MTLDKIKLCKYLNNTYDPFAEVLNRDLVDTNEQLVAATAKTKEMALQAEAANQAKSEFLATMSHELRTPKTGTNHYFVMSK